MKTKLKTIKNITLLLLVSLLPLAICNPLKANETQDEQTLLTKKVISKTVSKFFGFIKQRNYPSAYAMISDSTHQHIYGGYPLFLKFISADSALSNIKEVNITEARPHRGMGLSEVSIINQGNAPKVFHVELVIESSTLKIDDMMSDGSQFPAPSFGRTQ